MGLYDTICCDYPLPDPSLQNAEFQTKDLGEALCRYTITQDGRLLKHRRRADLTTGQDESSRDAAIVGGREIAYHGDIHMYASTTHGKVVTFCVRLTHGLVEWIRPASETVSAGETTATIGDLAESIDRIDDEHAQQAQALLKQLETLDPEVAATAIHVFDNRDSAATWMTRPNRALGGITPVRALANGDRQMVLDVLGRILYGIYS